MLIRCKGYNTGAKEYLEEGKKEGREFSRSELDERVILDGDLDLTKMVYESIPDNGQNRYLSFTMAFREDNVSHETLTAVTAEFKQFLMHAYKDDEFNFYAEAHLPKIRHIKDQKTGDSIERKPHIHIIIPRKNLLSGNEANPVGMYSSNERYFEAFQEYINQKYKLASPREHVRVDPKDAASVLSRYKGDDFYGKNREFKQKLVKQIIETGVSTRQDFYELVASHGEIKIRNQGKENEYVAVKLPDDAKFTNLKDTIFQDDFVVRRQLRKPPLEKHVIQERLTEWPRRAKELKYVSKATPSFRKLYKDASPTERTALLNQREHAFYADYGDSHDISPRHTKPKNRGKRSAAEIGTTRPLEAANGLQNMFGSDVAIDRQARPTQEPGGAQLLQGDAHLHLGQPDTGGDTGLRPTLPGGGSRRAPNGRGRPGGRAGVLTPAADGGTADTIPSDGRQQRIRGRRSGAVIPPYARDPRRRATIADIEQRGRRLFEPLNQSVESALEIGLVATFDPGEGTSRDPPAADPGSGQSGKHRKSRSSTSSKRNIPPYALNPHRVATITDIEARTRRLFAPLKSPAESALVMKLATFKKVAVNRNASTVAAYFNRQIEENKLLPSQRKAVQRVNKQFFEIRRSIFSDDRLTKRDKTQLVSVLTFERMKARDAIQNPSLYKEDFYMGSAEIRGLVNNEPQEELSNFTISGPGPNAPARDRVKALITRLTLQTNEKVSKERERELSAKDIYTKKSRFGQNVHYLSKTTDKTLFVDTGTAIAMRRTGITEAGVGVALQLATQRFGSTLTINGSAEFKRLVVEAASKSGMDIHFTDKKMNEALTLRRAELDIDKEGQQIQSPEAAGSKAAVQEVVTSGAEAAPVVVDRSIITGELVAHGPADYKGDPKNGPSYFVTLETETGPRTLWGVALEDVMADQNLALGERIVLKDLGRQPITIPQAQADGTIKHISGFRRGWSAERETVSINRNEPVTASTVVMPAASIDPMRQATAFSPVAESLAVAAQLKAHGPLSFEPRPGIDPRDRDVHVDQLVMDALPRYITVVPDIKSDADQVQTFSAFVGDLKIDTYESREIAEQSAAGHAFAFLTSDQLIEQITRLEQLKTSAPDTEASTTTKAVERPPEPVHAPLNFEPRPGIDPRDIDVHVDQLVMDALPRYITVVPDIKSDADQAQTFSAFVGDLKIDTYESREIAEQSAAGHAFAFFTSDQLIEQMTRLEQTASSVSGKEPLARAPTVEQAPSPSEMVQREQAWRAKFPLVEGSILSEAEVLSSDSMMGLRGEDHAVWLVATSDHTKEGVAMITAYMENDVYRDRFKTTLEDIYEQHQESPESIKFLDEATDFVEPLVNAIERRLLAEHTSVDQAQPGLAVHVTPPSLNFTHQGQPASLGLASVVESAPAAPTATPVTTTSAPAPLNFTHQGQPASLGLASVVESAPAAPTPTPLTTTNAPAPLNFTHQGQAASLGLSNGEVATKETEQEVTQTIVVEVLDVDVEEYGPEMN